MKKEQFDKVKTGLNNLLHSESERALPEKRIQFKALIRILDDYEYHSRGENKGRLTRLIIDSLEIDYSIGEKIIEFDEMIM